MKPLALLLSFAALAANAGDLVPQDVDLEKLPEGEPPPGIFVVDGVIRIKKSAAGKVLEISGEKPEVDAGAVIGQSTKGPAMIEARVLTTRAGRSFPRFGVGVHGQAGFRLMMVPARKELHLVKNDELIKAVPFAWTSGAAVTLRLVVTSGGDGKWTVTGKAWPSGAAEPAAPQITHETDDPAARGQYSIWGTPYAGTPVEFDCIKVGIER